jgi:hypothetical protein
MLDLPAMTGPNRARALVLALSLLLVPLACGTLPAPGPIAPLPPEAEAAFEEARAWARATPGQGASEQRARALRTVAGGGERATDPELAVERARSAARRALELAPDWVAPQRLLDDLARSDLLGLERVESYRERLAEFPDEAELLYLAGRLEGVRGGERFQRAVRADPDLAWGHHGLAWVAAQRGDMAAALRAQRLALARARGSAERSLFSAALARLLAGSDQSGAALDLLVQRLTESDVSAVDRVELSVQAAQLELGLLFRPEHARGWERALALLREHDLTDLEVEALVGMMRVFRTTDSPGNLEIQQALAARRGPARDRLRAELMLEGRPTPLALGLLRRSRGDGDVPAQGGPLLRAARFAAGQFEEAVDEWLADLPEQVVDSQGLPRDPALQAVVQRARALPARPDADALAELGQALVAAGWFREARSVAAVLAAEDLDRGLELEDRAGAGQAMVEGLRRLMNGIDQPVREGGRMASTAAGARIDPANLTLVDSGPVEGLDDLLGAMAPLVASAQTLLGGEVDGARIAADLKASPRMHYSSIGTLVHPGPSFSAADERDGLGARGEPVPGLAALCARLGRFGLFGQLAGEGAPDGVLLQRVAVEWRSGELLGAPWSGTVVWCEGTDVPPRAARRGATIAGAALHEGYWLDFDALRADRDEWAAFEREFVAGDGGERLARALEARGLALSARGAQARRSERRDVGMLLGQADRLRLAVLRDRLRALPPGAPRPAAGLISLEELVRVTGMHEEAHLCDRARFLPISRHLVRVMGLLLSAGFSPSGVARELEYRAELVALASAEDPRVVLVAILASVEAGGTATPHAAGYRELLSDFVATLDRDLAAHPERWPTLDPERTLIHQVHTLGPEDVRLVARLLAARRGLSE